MSAVCIISNPSAGSASQRDALEQAIAGRSDVTWCTTDAPGDGVRLARHAVDDGARRLVAVGGDGTVNEVLNGLMTAPQGVTLGVVPFGTGNDLSKTLALPVAPEEALSLAIDGEPRLLDVMEATAGDITRFGINVAAGGFSGQVDEKLTPQLKASWGPLAYLIGAMQALPDLRHYETFIRFDDEAAQRLDVLNVVVANGRTAAGGTRVAPRANPEDGLLDVVVILNDTVARLAETTARLAAGDYLSAGNVLFRRVRQVSIASTPGMWFNVDGELLTNEPARFCVRRGALPVVVGSGYEATPKPS